MLIPRRHVASFFDLTPDEHLSILALLDRARAGIDQEFHPDALNIGINDGPAAGQTVPHLHVHLIPRYVGDQPDPRGGASTHKICMLLAVFDLARSGALSQNRIEFAPALLERYRNISTRCAPTRTTPTHTSLSSTCREICAAARQASGICRRSLAGRWSSQR